MLARVMRITLIVSPAPRRAPPKIMAAAKPIWAKPAGTRHRAARSATRGSLVSRDVSVRGVRTNTMPHSDHHPPADARTPATPPASARRGSRMPRLCPTAVAAAVGDGEAGQEAEALDADGDGVGRAGDAAARRCG